MHVVCLFIPFFPFVTEKDGKTIRRPTQISTRPRANNQGCVKCRSHVPPPAVPTQGAIPKKGKKKEKTDLFWNYAVTMILRKTRPVFNRARIIELVWQKLLKRADSKRTRKKRILRILSISLLWNNKTWTCDFLKQQKNITYM